MKILLGIIVVCLSLITAINSAMAAVYYQYEMGISGTFDTSIHPTHGISGELPPSTYPFPQLLGGSFHGTFIYDTLNLLPWSASINIIDNTGITISSINVTTFRNEWGLLYFGDSFIPFALQRLEVSFGNQSLSALPSASELLSAEFTWGLIQTHTSAGDWDLPMVNASLELLNTSEFNTVPSSVPIPPSIWLLGSGLIGLVGLRRKFFRK